MTRCSGSGGHALNHDADQFGAGAEVEPDVACAGSTAVVDPRCKSDATTVEESRGGIVAEVERPTVQPREIARLRRSPPHLGQLLDEQPAQQRPVLVEPDQHGVEPVVGVGEGDLGGEDTQQSGVLG